MAAALETCHVVLMAPAMANRPLQEMNLPAGFHGAAIQRGEATLPALPALGKIKFGKFQLGGVAGSLLVAVLASQVGVEIDDGVKSVMFALFIYAVDYESGPDFFRSLGKQSIKEIILAAVLAVTGLLTVVLLAKGFDLDKGLAAGVAAGALTQSAIIGTAGDAITKLGLGADEVQRLQGNVAIGYAVSYVFGSFGAILVCVNLLPKFMGRSIKEDALKAESAIQSGVPVYGPGQEAAAPAQDPWPATLGQKRQPGNRSRGVVKGPGQLQPHVSRYRSALITSTSAGAIWRRLA